MNAEHPGPRCCGRGAACWLALISLAAAGTVLWWICRPLPVVPREALQLIDGRLCLSGQQRPFTGWMTELYPGGRLKSRSRVQAGLLHGVSEGFYTNGQLQVREEFLRGISHGRRVKWYPGGQLQSEAEIANGQLHGLFRRWHENGRLAEVIPMHRGQPQGLALAYDPDGLLKHKALLGGGEITNQPFLAPALAQSPPPGVAP